ncbi:MAG: HDOD domain-containing protein [Bryobacterales bacterium]|nr:HDOD domain-containing protein [Bryobacterales bacterium]
MMRQTYQPPSTAEYEEPVLEAHCRRVASAAIELSKRLGWDVEQQRALREAAMDHHHFPIPAQSRLLTRLVGEMWGYSPLDDTPNSDAFNQAGALELCCLFVQRWEFAPYEFTTWSDIVTELRALAADGFFDSTHVEALAVVPSVRLEDIRSIVSKLPVFPAIALKAIKIAQNPMASVAMIEDTVGADPVLAGEVIRAANSPLYSPALKIQSIRQAALFMGLPDCCRLLAAAALRPMFQSPLVRPLWNHSMEVARLAEALARDSAKAAPDEAFLCGLIHDVGRLALWKLPARLTQQYTTLLQNGCEPMFAETILAGFDHTVAGREVAKRWALPDALAHAVEFHHQPEQSDEILPSILYLAEHCSGSAEDLPSAARFQIALDRIGISRHKINSLPAFAAHGQW